MNLEPQCVQSVREHAVHLQTILGHKVRFEIWTELTQDGPVEIVVKFIDEHTDAPIEIWRDTL